MSTVTKPLATDETLDRIADALEAQGILNQLNTDTKSSYVAAINEVLSKTLDVKAHLCHNIPRLVPKDITSYYRDGSIWDRLNGTNGYELYEDLFVGDYFEMTEAISAYNQNSQYQAVGSKYVTIAGIDMHFGDGDGGDSVGTITYHHLDMVPGKGFDTSAAQHFGRSRMNSTNTTENGYVGSEMNVTTIGPVTTTGKRASVDSTATINEQLVAEFGTHLKKQRVWISNSMNTNGASHVNGATGCANGAAWVTVQAVLMSEVEVYGSVVWATTGYDIGNLNKQLPLFANSKVAMNNRSAYYWLTGIASSADFCYCHNYGYAHYAGASHAIAYVRPRFILAA